MSAPKKFQISSSPGNSCSREESPEYEPMHNPYRNLRCYDVVYDEQLAKSTKTLTLLDLAVKHAQSVPFRIQIVTSNVPEDVMTLAAGEVYTVHLIRETRILVAEQRGGEHLQIPINSSIKIGLVPQDHTHLYMTVGDILSAKQLPKAVAVHRQVLGSGSEGLQKSHVLLVKEAVRGKLGQKTALRIFNLSARKEMILNKDCTAEFITDPGKTQCYVTDLLDNDITFVPCSAQLYPSEGGVATTYPTTVTISKRQTRKSIIMSKFQDSPSPHPTFMDLPTTADVSVTIITTDQSSRIYDQIYEQSQYLLTNHKPSQIRYGGGSAPLLAEVKEGRALTEMVCSAPHQYHNFLTKREGTEVKAQRPTLLMAVSKSTHMACT
jgi:hypothetical protein